MEAGEMNMARRTRSAEATVLFRVENDALEGETWREKKSASKAWADR